MKIKDGKLVVSVSHWECIAIGEAMDRMEHSKWGEAGGFGRTQGEVLAAICRGWSEDRGAEDGKLIVAISREDIAVIDQALKQLRLSRTDNPTDGELLSDMARLHLVARGERIE